MKWAYGVLTCGQSLFPEASCKSRLETLLPQTLDSLAWAGFTHPRIFSDNLSHGEAIWLGKRTGLEVTARFPGVRTFSHWALSLWELYAREPLAKYYALFQDDLLCVRNLRVYLEITLPRIDRAYFNLITIYENEQLKSEGGLSPWRESAYLKDHKIYHGQPAQTGRGAVGLVFPNNVLPSVLSSPFLVNRVLDVLNGGSRVDGVICDLLNRVGIREYVHIPSPLQHTGEESTMSTRKHPTASTFPGSSFNAMEWLGPSDFQPN